MDELLTIIIVKRMDLINSLTIYYMIGLDEL